MGTCPKLLISSVSKRFPGVPIGKKYSKDYLFITLPIIANDFQWIIKPRPKRYILFAHFWNRLYYKCAHIIVCWVLKYRLWEVLHQSNRISINPKRIKHWQIPFTYTLVHSIPLQMGTQEIVTLWNTNCSIQSVQMIYSTVSVTLEPLRIIRWSAYYCYNPLEGQWTLLSLPHALLADIIHIYIFNLKSPYTGLSNNLFNLLEF